MRVSDVTDLNLSFVPPYPGKASLLAMSGRVREKDLTGNGKNERVGERLEKGGEEALRDPHIVVQEDDYIILRRLDPFVRTVAEA
jgi:hypothetical protein